MMVAMARQDDEELLVGQRISRNLQALLQAHNLRQNDLAERSGLSTSNISNLVNGRKNPSFITVAKAALALHVDPLELAGFRPLQIPERPSSEPNDRLQSLEARFDSLAAQVENLSTSILEYANATAGTQQQSTRKRRKVS